MSKVKLTTPRRNKNRKSIAATYDISKLELLIIGKSAKSKSVFVFICVRLKLVWIVNNGVFIFHCYLSLSNISLNLSYRNFDI